MVSTHRYELKVTQDAVLRDAAFYPLTEFPKMQVNPDVKAEILEGLKTNWAKGCLYIGNQWKD
jgi:hypothetical protein